MILARPDSKPAHDAQPSAVDVQGEIRGLIRKEMAIPRRPPEPSPSAEVVPSEAKSVVESVSTASMGEIDKLIGQLTTLREFFKNEGQRIQREIAEYSQLSDAMLKSTKMMAENMAQLNNTVETSQDNVE